MPIFVSRRTIANWLCIDVRKVRERFGVADVKIRYGGYLTESYFRWRLFPECVDPDFADDGRPLYSINEAAKLCGLNRKPTESRLVAVAFFDWGHCGYRLKLFRERDCLNLRRKIASREIKVQSRSCVRPKFNAYVCDARHSLAADQITEQQRIEGLRLMPKFFAANV